MKRMTDFFNPILAAMLGAIFFFSGVAFTQTAPEGEGKTISSSGVRHPYRLNGHWWADISGANQSADEILTTKMAMIQATWEAVALADPMTFAKYFDCRAWKDPENGMLRCVVAVNKFYELDANLPLPLFHALAAVTMRENGAPSQDIKAFMSKVRNQLGLPREP